MRTMYASRRTRLGTMLALALLCGLASTAQAQPLFERVNKDKETLDAWWNMWNYEQLPRAVLAPNMFGDFLVNTPMSVPTTFTIPGTTTNTGTTTTRQISGTLTEGAGGGNSAFLATAGSSTLTLISPQMSLLGRTLPNSNFTTAVPVPAAFPGTLAIRENPTVTQSVQNQFATGTERAVFNRASLADDSVPGTGFYDVLLVYDLVSSTTGTTGTAPVITTLLVAMPNPSGGGLVGRSKPSTDNSPMPRDRLIWNFDFLDNTPVKAGQHDLNRFVFGFEKTFLDGKASLEVRLPFASTVSSTADEGIINGKTAELGNLYLNMKKLLYNSQTLALTGGLGWSLPTADDTRLVMGGSDLVRIKNSAVLVTPYVAALFTPSDRVFAQAWAQFSYDLNGSEVVYNPTGSNAMQVGRLTDSNLMQLDLQVGYWLLHPTAPSWGVISGLAPFLELHYNTSLSNTDSIASQGLFLYDSVAKYDDMNLTLGALTQLNGDIFMTTGLTIPLRSAPDRFADLQIGVRFTWFFGATSDARGRALYTF